MTHGACPQDCSLEAGGRHWGCSPHLDPQGQAAATETETAHNLGVSPPRTFSSGLYVNGVKFSTFQNTSLVC